MVNYGSLTGTREFLKNKKLFGFRTPPWRGCLDCWLEGILQTRVLGLLSFTVFETSRYGYKDKKNGKYIHRSEKSKIYFKFEDWYLEGFEWRKDTTKQEIDATFYRHPQRDCMLGQAITNAWGNTQPFAQKRYYDNII